jgi:type I restriction enzyme S subunit
VSARDLITEHLDLWTGAVTKKSSSGRGSNGKVELTGVKKLRELILELAVKGLLVEQDPKEEPTHRILERLDTTIKNNNGQPRATSGASQPSRPAGWAAFRVGDCLDFQYGKSLPAKQRDDSGNVEVYGSNGVVGFHNEALTKERCIVVGRKGSAGALNKALAPSWTTDVAYYVQPPKGFDFEFTYLLLQSLHLDQLGKGIKPGVNRNEAYALIASLPPLEEQHRIVQKVDELMALCDQLEQQTGDQLEAHETLVDALLGTLTQSENATELADNWARLAAHFDTLFTTEQSIDKLKQTILQLAVVGRLVEQDAEDEPVESLLNRLTEDRQAWLQEQSSGNPECKTMQRKLNKVRPAQSPFSLPKSWRPAHLIQLCRMLVDCHNKTAPYVEEGTPIIRTSNIRERRFNFNELKYVDDDTYTYWSRRCPPEPGDIIFTREAPMGEAAIIPAGKTWCLGQRTMLIRPMREHISNQFLLLTLTEPHLLERAAEKAIGSTVKHLRVGDVENLVVPVPPLEEQHRIVQKADELMALCDRLKDRLQQASGTRCQLAEAVVEGALS